MSWQRRIYSCSRCNRHRSQSFLQPLGNLVGLYCPVCRREIRDAAEILAELETTDATETRPRTKPKNYKPIK